MKATLTSGWIFVWQRLSLRLMLLLLCCGLSNPSAATTVVVGSTFDYNTTATFTNTNTSDTYQFTVPQNHDGWRLVLESNQAVAINLFRVEADNSQVNIHNYSGTSTTIFFQPTDLTAAQYRLVVSRVSNVNASYTLASEGRFARDLNWDNGSASPARTDIPNAGGFNGGDWIFRLQLPTELSHSVARFVLDTAAGSRNMNLQLHSGNINNTLHSATAVGDDVVYLTSQQLSGSQTLYLRVSAAAASSGTANWSLYAGDIHVVDLGDLQATDASNGKQTVGVEQRLFYKTAVGDAALGWRLFLSSLEGGSKNHALYIRKSLPALPEQGSFDKQYQQQTLLVPDYLSTGTYFVTVNAPEGTVLNLKSSTQPITNLGFAATTPTLSVDGAEYGYHSYRVQVPVDQVAWETKLRSLSGDSNLYVRRNNLPNITNNDGLSEATGTVTDTITHVPPMLDSGNWYITVHASTSASYTLSSGLPVITDIAFVNDPTAVANGASFENTAGWRYFRVTDIQSQLANSMGWELKLNQQLANTRLAVRRNAVPSVWRYRQNDQSQIYEGTQYAAISGSGLLQKPRHEADIWYVGVFNPAQLGAFSLNTYAAAPPGLDFNAGVQNVSAQDPTEWRFFKVTVPSDAKGWLLQLANVTSGAPELVISRDLLPDQVITDYCGGSLPLYRCTNWPSGLRLASQGDISQRYTNAQGQDIQRRRIVLGMNTLLETGTYYVGVRQSGNSGTPLSYQLQSIGIGQTCNNQPCSRQITPLAMGASVQASITEPGELAFYQVEVPENLKGWQVSLQPTTGETALLVNQSALPGSFAYAYHMTDDQQTYDRMGRLANYAGTEYFYRFEQTHYVNNSPVDKLRGGSYYLTVVSQGNTGRTSSQLGAGAVSFTLANSAYAALDQTASPVTENAGQSFTDQQLQPGEARSYRVRTAAGLASLQLQLQGTIRGSYITVRHDPAGQGKLPYATFYSTFAGSEGGFGQLYSAERLITLNPEQGDYTLTVTNAAATPALFRLDIGTIAQPTLAFNNGSTSVTEQDAKSWRYFKVVVPADAKGWDVKLVQSNTESRAGFVIRKALPPIHLQNDMPQYLPVDGGWPDGSQLMASNHVNSQDNSKRLILGMGAHLVPGTYYIGVTGEGYQQPLSYQLISRGIGTNCGGVTCTIPVTPLAYQGSASADITTPGDVRYYEIEVPQNATSWTLRSAASTGEVAMVIDHLVVPDNGGSGYQATVDGVYNSMTRTVSPAKLIYQPGDEFYYKAREQLYNPNTAQQELTLTPGKYYVGVISMGNSSNGTTIGTGSVSFELSSGPFATDAKLTPVLSSGMQHQWTQQQVRQGQLKFYRFRVMEGTTSLNLNLRYTSGAMTIAVLNSAIDAELFPHGHSILPIAMEGGINAIASTQKTLTISQPKGEYTIAVTSSACCETAFDLTAEALGELTLDFNAGQVAVAEQPSGSWRYFSVNVPANAQGWNLLLQNISSGSPQVVVAKDRQPTNPYGVGYAYCPHYRSPFQCRQWTSEMEIGMGPLLTRRAHSAASVYDHSKQLLLGMGAPLEAGSYVVGVYAHGQDAASYQLRSEGIGENCGTESCTIPVIALDYNGVATGNLAQPGQLVFYKVTVPEQTSNWQVALDNLQGDALLLINHQFLPNTGSNPLHPGSYRSDTFQAGVYLDKPGSEFFYKFAEATQVDGAQRNQMSTGEYYLGVVSQGQGSTINNIGTGAVSYRLRNSAVAINDQQQPMLQSADSRLISAQSLANGEMKAYRFQVAPGVDKLQIRLLNSVGNPRLAAVAGSEQPDAFPQPNHDWLTNRQYYSVNNGEGGLTSRRWGEKVITLANVSGQVTVLVNADRHTDGSYPDASFDLQVSAIAATQLAFDGGAVSQLELVDEQVDLFRVVVPETTEDGEPVAGWQLTHQLQAGEVAIRVKKDAPPGTEQYYNLFTSSAEQLVIAAPYLTPGVWYVEIKASGLSRYNIQSNAVRGRSSWTLPVTETDGQIQGDSGEVELAKSNLHFYRLEIPEGNNALIHTELINISGNTDLYLRRAVAPTRNHNEQGSNGSLFDLVSQESGTSYANWGITTKSQYRVQGKVQLTPGTWWLAVAAPDSNATYRLKVNNGNIQQMALNSSKTGQVLAAGDMRYYKLQMPAMTGSTGSSIRDWVLNLTQQRGDVVAYLRQGIPPVHGSYQGNVYDIRNDDNLYQAVLEEGQLTLDANVLVPGSAYYIGVYARNDAEFDLTSATDGDAVVLADTLAAVNDQGSYLVPANSQLVVRVAMPADLEYYRHQLTLPYGKDVKVFLSRERSYTPSPNNELWGASALYYSTITLEQRLMNRARTYLTYPWQPSADFYLTLVNYSTTAETVNVQMRGNVFEEDTVGPVFSELLPIVLEATGPLTDYEPGVVYTLDAIDGYRIATTPDFEPKAVGVYQLVWTATDLSGNSSTATQQLTIRDTRPPVVTAPAAITVEATGATTAVDPGTATATDLVSGDLAATADKTGPFAVGSHTLTWTATDGAGNEGYGYQTILVQDTTAPVLSGVVALQVSTALPNGVSASLPLIQQWLAAVKITDNSDAQATFSHNLPATLAVGNTIVTFSAQDQYGNTSSTQAVIMVKYVNEKPVIVLPKNLLLKVVPGQVVLLTDPVIQAFLAEAKATDKEDGVLPVSHNAPAQFPPGVTAVTFTALDKQGQQSTGIAYVSVQLPASKKSGMNRVLKIILMNKGKQPPAQP